MGKSAENSDRSRRQFLTAAGALGIGLVSPSTLPSVRVGAPSENERIARQYFLGVWNGNPEAADRLVGHGYVMRGGDDKPRASGPAGVQAVVSGYMRAFPNLTVEVEETISAGDKVVLRWTARGTHRGVLRGIAPTGREVSFRGIHILTVRDGKVAEERYVYDSLDLYEQIGSMPRR